MHPDVHSPPLGMTAPVSASVGAPSTVPSLDPIAVPTLIPTPTPTRTPATVSSGSGRWVLEWTVVLAVAVVLAVVVRTFVAQMFFIPSGSMLPTLQIGERIVVDKLSYHLHGVQRGDIVVFKRPPLEQADYSDLVKRVIGLPGETISSVDGRVLVNGKPLDEPWLPQPSPTTSPSPLPDAFSLTHPYTIPSGEYFVMGDNRTNSEDSRYFGPIAGNLIVGKMAFEVWPVSDTGWMAVLSVAALVVLVLLLLALRRPRGPPLAARA